MSPSTGGQRRPCAAPPKTSAPSGASSSWPSRAVRSILPPHFTRRATLKCSRGSMISILRRCESATRSHMPCAPKLVWNTADAIWNAVGDTSDDYNWYTKRMTLSGVFSSTLLFWLGDTSPGREATWCFLDRRIGNVMDFEKLKSRVRKNPLARLALSGPKAILSRVRPPADPAARAEGLDVGFPGRRIS